MNARRVAAAEGVILAAMQTRQTAACIAIALDSAQLLQSPESATEVEIQSRELSAARAELKELRARVAGLETQSPRVRTEDLVPGDRVWHPYDMAVFTVSSIPEKLKIDLRFHTPNSAAASESGMRVTGTDDSGEPVHVDAAQSYFWTRDGAAAELEQLRARVAELEAELAKYVGNEPTIAEEMTYLSRCLDAVRDVCDAAEKQATRWEQPLPVPEWVAMVRNAADGVVASAPAPPPAPRRQQEDPHKSPLHHDYALGHDLPARADLPESLR